MHSDLAFAACAQISPLEHEPTIPAPASWRVVDAPRAPRLMAVHVELPDGRADYSKTYTDSMDAYAEALRTYPDCTSITVTPQ